MKLESRGSVGACGRSRITMVFTLAVMIAFGGARESLAVTDSIAPELEVQMPDYVVVGERPLPRPESWRYASVPAIELTRGERVVVAPGFEILSSLSVQNTRLLVKELQRRQLVGAVLWPALVKGSPFQPLTVVIDLDKQASRIDLNAGDSTSVPVDRGVLLSWRGEPIAGAGDDADVNPFSWIFAPQTKLTGAPGIAASREAPVVARPTNVEVWGDPPFRVAEVSAGDLWAGFSRPSEELLAAEISEQTAMLALAALCERSKPWLRFGLGRLIATTQVSATEIEFAGVPVMMARRRIPKLRVVLEKERILTPEEMELGSAFVHYGLYGHNGKFALRFIQLVERHESEPLSEGLMKETMGKSIRRMDAEVRGFTRSFAYFRSIKMRGRLPDMLPVTVREATQAEVARVQARLSIAQARSDLALNGLRIAYRRGEREPAMLALLAELEASHGSLDRAERIVESLVNSRQPPAAVFLLAGRITLSRIAGDSAERRLDGRETALVLQPLARGIREGQGAEELWTFLAEVVLRSTARPHESIAEILDQAVQRYPNNVTLWKAAEMARAKSNP